MPNKRVAVLFHNDSDGFGAAYAAAHGLMPQGIVDLKEIENAPHLMFLEVQYGQEPPYEQLREFAPEQVYILDFSYPAGVLTELMDEFGCMAVLDHHRTAAEDLKDFDPIRTCESRYECGVHIDQTKSGCVLAWEHFNPGEPVPEILLYVQDRDLWKFDLEHSKEINAFIATLPKDFREWAEFYTPEAYDAGKAILRFQAGQIDRRIKDVKIFYYYPHTHEFEQGCNRLPRCVTYHEVPIVNATENISELGDALGAAYPDAPFTMSYCDRPDGKRSYSLRSRNGFDCSAVARAFGGGGHAGAAGFTLDSPDII